jgi:predicted ATPase/DNA-binding XRE family transcriptional regulator
MEVEDRASSSPEFGSLLRRHRLAAGLSQEALAERARMSTDGISALERGHRRTPQRETLALLCGALALDGAQRLEFEAAASRAPVPRRGGAVAVGPWSDAATANLPRSLTSFVGRVTELDEIAALLRKRRLVTITGAGGVGKTQTALRAASALSDEIAVRFVGLAPIADRKLVAAAIASALGIQEMPNRPLLETVTFYLRNRAMLLLFDNCEHVVAETAGIADRILSECPDVRILATSREPLKSAGEHAYRLPSLSPESSIELFAERAHAVDHHFSLSDKNEAIVGEICRHLDGVPLAIELAAARVNLLSIRDLAAKLDDRLHILRGGERTAVSRQQTMRATIEWSYDLLSAKEKRVFERLSVFFGGCTLETAAEVCTDEEIAQAEILDLLSSLVDKSLLVAELEWCEPRYVLLESFRQFGREKLALHGERDAAAHRHALALLQVAVRFDHAVLYDGDEVYQELAEAEMSNWRAALQWALAQRGDVLCGLRLVGQLHGLWHNVDKPQGRRWLSLALGFVDERTPREVEARLRVLACGIAGTDSKHEEACAASQHAIDLCRSIGDAIGMVRAQNVLAFTLERLGRTDEAKAVLEDMLPLARRLDLRVYVAFVMYWMGEISFQQEDYTAARGFYDQSAQTFDSIGRRFLATIPAGSLSIVDLVTGNAESALALALQCVSSRRTERSLRAPVPDLRLAELLHTAAICFIASARYDEARAAAFEALEISRDVNEATSLEALQSIAAATALETQAEADNGAEMRSKAARMLGYVDARVAAMGTGRETIVRWEYDLVVTALQAAMDVDALAACTGEGAAMSENDAFLAASELART